MGLSATEVEARQRAGQTNAEVGGTSRSWLAIVRANVLTRFNALLGGLLVAILIIGPLQDALFGIILVVNTGLGIIQEYRARRALDRLAFLQQPVVTVLRDGEPTQLSQQDVVIDDLLLLSRGDQVVVDGEVIDSRGLAMDESLLSGEAEPVGKSLGDKLWSGSSVVAGSGLMRTTAVGEAALSQGFASEAKRFSLVSSELQSANNTILRLVTWAILPIGGLLAWSQLSGHLPVDEALRNTVAGVANMVPEGLVLLTTVAYAAGALRLTRKRVLIRELAAVEGLARVDTLCIDKTGTITTGAIHPLAVEQLAGELPATAVIAALAAAEETPTGSLSALAALSPTRTDELPSCSDHVPFSSERRWSAATFTEWGSFVLGAPEALLAAVRPSSGRGGDLVSRLKERIAEQATAGHRVLMLARSPGGLTGERLPEGLEPMALGVLAEEIRPDAATTLQYLAREGVRVKVISGDSPTTVAAIAARVGLAAGDPVDCSQCDEGADYSSLAESHEVFGRVAPRQKRALVAALQKDGHVVAMTGDGVNDVLALRDADLGIAMGSGSSASRSAGRVVLLDDAFSLMPSLLAEGRRVLANVERTSKLFVTKTVYATVMALAIGIAQVPYPFYPRNFTVVSTFTIGLPAVVLAMLPASTRLQRGYLTRVAAFAAPTGVVLGAAALAVYLSVRVLVGGMVNGRTAAMLVLGAGGLVVLSRLARPPTYGRLALVVAMAVSFVGVILWPTARDLLAIDWPGREALAYCGLGAAASTVVLEVIWRIPVPEGRRKPKGGPHEPSADR